MKRPVLVLLAFATAAALAGTIQNPKSKVNAFQTFDFNAADRHERAMHPGDEKLSLNTRARTSREDHSDFWMNIGKDFVQQKLNNLTNRKRAKNVIMFLGDGMSATTIAAARPYINAEETFLSWERFPDVGAAKTYCVNVQVADSACTSTAYLSGVKANYGTLGVTANVTRNSCTQHLDKINQVSSIAQWAVDAGKVAGLVTNAGVTEASPAGLYAHSSYRYWENDQEVQKYCDSSLVPDIARQLIEGELGSKLRVILGGRRGDFRSNTTTDEENLPGFRGDGRDLIEEWLAKKVDQKASYVWNATQLRSLDIKQHVDYLLGLFSQGPLPFNKDIQATKAQDKVPALHEMTRSAIEVLSKHEEGFFLFVENDHIDTAHHDTHARLALDETAELSKAVALARAMLPDDDTLIVVTSDHSHTMTYSGNSYRGNDITGPAGPSYPDQVQYMTLSYANGPGHQNNEQPNIGHVNLENIDTNDLRFKYPALVPSSSETHAGEDVLVYASGPWSHLFNGNYEQHVIPYLMAYASCLNGLGPSSCFV